MFHASKTDLPLGFEVPPYDLPSRVPNAFAVYIEAIASGPDSAVRLVRAMTEGGSYSGGALLIEARAEQLRQAGFADRPRRFDCTFGLRTLAEAINYSAMYHGAQHVFEVELIGEPETLCGDFGLVTVGFDDASLPSVAMAALDTRLRAYWQTMTEDLASAPPGWEVLVVGRLRVTSGCLTQPAHP